MKIKSFKRRKIDYSRPVHVYRNLNRVGKIFSIRQDGLVVGHSEIIYLKNCEFIINKNGQQRARKQQRRNVHAYIIGDLIKEDEFNYKSSTINKWGIVSYNPFKEDHFVIVNYMDGDKYMMPQTYQTGRKPIHICNLLKINNGTVSSFDF
jgi:hypothetical protein